MIFVPAAISALILAAHFLRWGNLLGVAAVLTLTALALFVRRAWSLKLMQGMLLAAPLMWIFMAFRTAQERMAEGRPFLRAGLIFVFVAVFTAYAAYLLGRPKARERFGR